MTECPCCHVLRSCLFSLFHGVTQTEDIVSNCRTRMKGTGQVLSKHLEDLDSCWVESAQKGVKFGKSFLSKSSLECNT